MVAEHDDPGEIAAQIRRLSANFHPPEDACSSYRALYFGLEEFERDLTSSGKKNILFAGAVEMERKEVEDRIRARISV